MHLSLPSKFLIRSLALLGLLAAFVCPPHTAAQTAVALQAGEQDHIVTPQALQQQAVQVTATRQKNIDTLTNLLGTPTAQKAMHDAKVDPVQVKNAIPTLSDDELANLSGRVTKAQSDLSAGILGTGMFTLIILVVILIIIVIAIR